MTHVNFLGIPVEGDINAAARRIPQRPLSDLAPLIRAVLDDDFIESVGWDQYTPYFNDGDPCEFNVCELYFRTTADADVEDTYELEVGFGVHPSLGGCTTEWVGRERIVHPYAGNHEALHDACSALSRAIESGAFDHVLLDAFGDHATVVMQATGITVDTYDHD